MRRPRRRWWPPWGLGGEWDEVDESWAGFQPCASQALSLQLPHFLPGPHPGRRGAGRHGHEAGAYAPPPFVPQLSAPLRRLHLLSKALDRSRHQTTQGTPQQALPEQRRQRALGAAGPVTRGWSVERGLWGWLRDGFERCRSAGLDLVKYRPGGGGGGTVGASEAREG
jgi:hypothetical protein